MNEHISQDLDLAKQIQARGLEFVIVREGAVLASGHRHGIAEILGTIEALGAQAAGAVLADHVIGRAVALLALQAKLAAVHGQILSASARIVLQNARLPFTFDKQVSQVLNNTQTGLCPFEQATQTVSDPATVIAVLQTTLATMRGRT